jgi:hypothetical protein
MKGEKWFWVGIGLIVIGVYWAILDEMQNKYEQGYAAGANSLSDKQVDEVCVQWLFQSNLVEAKKRVCGK